MIIETSDDVAGFSVPWTSQVMVWIMLLPTIGLMLFWNQIQNFTISSVKLFLGS